MNVFIFLHTDPISLFFFNGWLTVVLNGKFLKASFKNEPSFWYINNQSNNTLSNIAPFADDGVSDLSQ